MNIPEAHNKQMSMRSVCAFCQKSVQGKYSIHRDAFGAGPEVDLCDGKHSAAAIVRHAISAIEQLRRELDAAERASTAQRDRAKQAEAELERLRNELDRINKGLAKYP